jgi:hypothetical protein
MRFTDKDRILAGLLEIDSKDIISVYGGSKVIVNCTLTTMTEQVYRNIYSVRLQLVINNSFEPEYRIDSIELPENTNENTLCEDGVKELLIDNIDSIN